MSRFDSISFSVLVSSAVLATTAAGCGGSTTDAGAPHEEASNKGGGSGPRPAPASGSLTAECDGAKGLTGNSVLDKLDVPATAVFSRFPPETPYGYTDPTTATRAIIRIRYEGGEVRCTPGETLSPRMNPTVVPPRVAVVVSVDFTTADGLFDEHVQGELSSQFAALKGINLLATIPVAAVGGSYRKTAAADKLGPSIPMKLTGSFTTGDFVQSRGGVDHGETFVGTFGFER